MRHARLGRGADDAGADWARRSDLPRRNAVKMGAKTDVMGKFILRWTTGLACQRKSTILTYGQKLHRVEKNNAKLCLL